MYRPQSSTAAMTKQSFRLVDLSRRLRLLAVFAILYAVACVYQTGHVLNTYIRRGDIENQQLRRAAVDADAFWLPPETTSSTSTRADPANQSQRNERTSTKDVESTPLTTTTSSTTNTTTQTEASEDLGAFGACLIIKDDNHWLIEWLAYHYHVLPLRHLIVVQDPDSRTSPDAIFKRWTDSEMMQIETWKDERFLPHWVTKMYNDANNKKADNLWLHLNRQMFFYGACLRHFHQQQQQQQYTADDRSKDARDHQISNRDTIDWVLLTDSDEFVRVNPYLLDDNNSTSTVLNTGAAGHVMQYVRERERQEQLQNNVVNKPMCLRVPRLQVVSKEDDDKDSTSAAPISALGEWMNPPSNLLTYRWLYHNGHEMSTPKNVINVRTLSKDQIPKKASSVHHVIPDLCPPMHMTQSKIDPLQMPYSWLIIQHYLGTYEQFTYRDDPRDDKQERRADWKSRGHRPATFVRDDGLKLWLPGFVDSVGADEAARLLQNVGVVEKKPLAVESNNPVAARAKSQSKNAFAATRDDDSFAACLLIKDDNHWLIEWLAYHYHVLPLRRVLVVCDPTSQTSPDAIFGRWNDLMNVTYWTDDDFLPAWVSRKFKAESIDATRLHRYRQQFFYANCLKALKQEGQSWVLLSDTDEFIKPNRFNTLGNVDINDDDSAPLLTPGSVLQALNDFDATRKSPDTLPKCLHVPRLQMTAKESDSSLVQHGFPDTFNASDFLTARWLYHNGHEITTGHNLDGKNIINVARLELSEIPNKAENVHYIIPKVCPATAGNRLDHPDSPLVIHHYLGTFEQYSFRSDPRDSIQRRAKRDRTLWMSAGQTASQPANQQDTGMRGWLQGFVESVGAPEAMRLLQGVGVVGIE